MKQSHKKNKKIWRGAYGINFECYFFNEKSNDSYSIPIILDLGIVSPRFEPNFVPTTRQ